MKFLVPIFSRYGAIAVQFFLVFLVTQSLSQHDAGIYLSLFGFVLTTYFAAGLGLPDGAIKEYAELNAHGKPREARRLLSNSLQHSILSVLGISTLILLALWGFAYENSVFIAIWWLSYGTTFVTAQTLVASGRQQLGTFIFYSAINVSLLAVVVPFLALSNQITLEELLGLTALASFLAAGAALAIVLTSIERFPLSSIDAHMVRAWRVGASIALGRTIQAAIIWSPVWIAVQLLGPHAGALMGLATRLVSAVAAAIAATRFSIRPELAAFAARNDWVKIRDYGSRIALAATSLSLAAMIGNAVVGEQVIGYLYGPSYVEVYLLIAILLFGTLGESIGGPVDEVLKMSGSAQKVLQFQFAIAFVGVALQFALGNYLGLGGVALGYSISFSLLYLMQIIHLKRARGIVILPQAPKKIRKAMLWIRYLRHISLLKIIKKVLHERLSRKIAAAPETYLKPLSVVGDPFTSHPLLMFGERYKVQGDRFHNATSLYTGVFETKGVRQDFGDMTEASWDDPFPDQKNRLHWSHDFAFFSFSLSLVEQDPERAVQALAVLVKRMETRHPVRSRRLHFVWTPIALSLRLMGICSALALARHRLGRLPPESANTIAEHVNLCAALLERTAERYLGYNHLVFAETALAVARVALGHGAETQVRLAVHGIENHLLGDGFWSERSPTYHIHMQLLLRSMVAMNVADPSTHQKAVALLSKMNDALDAVVLPDGEIAVLNDAAIADSVPPSAVGWTKDASVRDGVRLLAEAGYVKLSRAGTTVVFDAGPMGPDDVIGHGHADFLSVNVTFGDRRLFVDPGVASIANDELRRWSRSSEFHNGPRFDSLEPAEFFGAWRVGRRGRAWLVEMPDYKNGLLQVKGACDGFRSEAGLVYRTVAIDNAGCLTIQDEWSASGHQTSRVSTFLMPADCTISGLTETEMNLKIGEIVLIVDVSGGSAVYSGEMSYYPTGPLAPHKCHCVRFIANSDCMTLRISRV
ncbi:heparinase II/III domain-containing protein [Mongoliimonas terrestris]|uniref:heparinase II/III domain-containing protein n=1 Tax=Mongoliimonas terrestris TaxID=1709001 RepID=UPI0009FAAE12|nr:heparinase II/III family protein [Mongoliimonas terrestris]